MTLLAQLRQRGVLRVAAWYAAGAWVLIQVASTVFPQFDLPQWSVRAVIVAALLGLPLALLAAWTFDLTPGGIRRTESVDGDAAARRAAPFWRIPSLWIALAAGVLLAIGAQQAWRLVRTETDERPSIAVLPFSNLSPDPGNAYFADGLHEEILATLARVSGIRVISRTSVLEYRDARRNIKDIARALDVGMVLEGSVRRVGDEVRVTLQLIDGRNDEHLWSQTYDRAFEDILGLQQTVALQITAELGAKLAPGEQDRIVAAASASPEAYDRYLHALALYDETGEPGPALGLLDEAIRLDPAFAHAHALRARIQAWSYGAVEPRPEWRDGAWRDIERALQLQPEMPEALVARGVYYTYVIADPARAAEDFTRALAVAPNDATAHHMAGFTMRRLGRAEEAMRHFEQAFALGPQWGYGFDLVFTLMGYGRFARAEKAAEELLARHPELPAPRLFRYFIRFQATGDTAGWREEWDRLREVTNSGLRGQYSTYAMFLALQDYAGLVAYIERIPADQWMPTDSHDFAMATACIAAGDPARARPYLEEEAKQVNDDIGPKVVAAAMALELLGRRAEALQAADRAIALLPEVDARNNPRVRLERAWVLVRSGDRAEEGYAELARQLGQFELQPRWVSISPPWMLSRDDARVQQIIRAAIAKQDARVRA